MDHRVGSIPASGTIYPDRKHEFVRVLWKEARKMSHNMRADQKQKRSSLIRAITNVALFPKPLKTTQAADLVKGRRKIVFDLNTLVLYLHQFRYGWHMD